MRRTRPLHRTFIGALLAACALSACSQSARYVPYVEVPINEREPPHSVDLLFVVDNSNGCREEQPLLAEQAELLLRDLVDSSAVADLHVGVISPNLGTGGYFGPGWDNPMHGDYGELQYRGRLEGCERQYFAGDCDRDECPWLIHSTARPDDGSDPADPPIWDDLACVAVLGVGLCGFEQPLEAMFLALTERSAPGQPNEGFLREDSVLAVVIMTDEDDCSYPDVDFFNPSRPDLGPMNLRCALNPGELHPVERYAEMLLDLRPGGEDLVVAAIAGVPTDGSWSPGDPLDELRHLQQVDPEDPNMLLPVCDTDLGLAFPPVRIADLVGRFGDQGILGSICRHDWSDTLTEISRAILDRMDRPEVRCVELPGGVDPDVDCRLVEIATEEVVEAWTLGHDEPLCPDAELRLGGDVELTAELRFECRLGE